MFIENRPDLILEKKISFRILYPKRQWVLMSLKFHNLALFVAWITKLKNILEWWHGKYKFSKTYVKTLVKINKNLKVFILNIL